MKIGIVLYRSARHQQSATRNRPLGTGVDPAGPAIAYSAGTSGAGDIRYVPAIPRAEDPARAGNTGKDPGSRSGQARGLRQTGNHGTHLTPSWSVAAIGRRTRAGPGLEGYHMKRGSDARGSRDDFRGPNRTGPPVLYLVAT